MFLHFSRLVLEQANLHSSNLTGADLTGVNLSRAELRQANCSRVNLQGANLQGANLRWADLSGADLRWADLSGAVLSGANLTGADLSNATLLGTTLVHVNLSNANLSGVDWTNADLTGATIDGIKLHRTNRYGAILDDVSCRWIDLSMNADRVQTYHFSSNDPYEFFYRSAPKVEVTLDASIAIDAASLMASTYRKLTRVTPLPTPNLATSRHRTTLSFELGHDRDLFLTAAAAIFPFADAEQTQTFLTIMLKSVPHDLPQTEALQKSLEKLQSLMPILHQMRSNLDHVFFQVPTNMQLVNSEGQSLTIYQNPGFGKRSVPLFQSLNDLQTNGLLDFSPPPEQQVTAFIKAFRT